MVYYYENILVIPSKEIIALEKKKNAQKILLLISEFALQLLILYCLLVLPGFLVDWLIGKNLLFFSC